MPSKKLIEVALPLEKINAESAREKSIRHGHPSTLHLWWARRPLAAARAVIWSSIIDDPSSHPELFPTEEDQNQERQRLFKILEDLVVWENSNNEEVLKSAKYEIEKVTGGSPLELLDPFAGGGAIPLEAHRLGLEAHAHDLNPVAVLINKAMVEIPSIFSSSRAVNPFSNRMVNTWSKTEGLVSDIQYYGKLLKDEAYKKVGMLYPEVRLPQNYGGKSAAIAWIWTRTVKCPNPACGCEMPLIRNFILSKNKKGISYIKPSFDKKGTHFEVCHEGKPKLEGTVGRKGGVCVNCGTPVSLDYIRDEGKAKRMNSKLCAIVAEHRTGRLYLSADIEQELAANVDPPIDFPDADIPVNPRDFKTPNYGMTRFAELFTNRQLLMLTTFCNSIEIVRKKIEADAKKEGFADDHVPLEQGGTGALAYSQALSVYLAFVIDKMTDYHSTICSWHSSKELIRNTFGRQAIPMTWDYAETNPFSSSAGCFDNMLEWVVKCVANLPVSNTGSVEQHDAQTDCGLRNVLVSTDPPYYDNIGYADLSDFFYIWLRQSLRTVYPKLFTTMMVPKNEELVATPYRFGGGANEAKIFFENGMLQSCKQIYLYASDEYPVTIYYAYKQSNTDEKNNTTSSGWETMLSAVINAGFIITGTWPVRTEMANRNIASGSNALASSIVLVCRKRSEEAPQTTKKNLVNALRRELRPALKKLQDSNIAPVDLAQSAIGPGMGVFSKYSRVLEADGSPMTVRSALQIINEEIDMYFNEQIGSMDIASRFCVDLYTQCAYNNIKYGEAEVLANAKGIAIATMAAHGVLHAKAGQVHLIERDEMPEKVDTNEGNIWMLTQQLTRAMAKGGVNACAKIIFNMFGSNAENAKDLAYRLYTIAERKGWAEEAYAYNSLVVAWPDIQTKAAELKAVQPKQMTLFDLGIIDNN